MAVLRQRAARRYANESAPGEQKEDDDTTPGPLAPVLNDTMAITKTKSKGEHVNFWADLEKQVWTSAPRRQLLLTFTTRQ